jgi:hypothetical protein
VKRPSWPTLAAIGCAALLAFLYVSPVLKDVRRTGLDWPIWLDHPEGVSLTAYGRWWVLPPHSYLSDGVSGEFPVYVYYLSDSLINLVAEALGAPPMTVQAVLYGPALAFGFLLLNYFSIRAVVRDPRVALGASLLLSLGASSILVDRPDPVSGLPLNSVLHVPFRVITLATAQSLGWVLLLPCLGVTERAYRGFTPLKAGAAGALLAALFHVHTLTFVNAAAAQLAYLVFANLLERPRDRRFVLWLASLALVAIGFVFLASRAAFPFAGLVALGGAALAATFLLDPNKAFYLWCYGVASLLALPYVLTVAPYARELAAVQATWASIQLMAVGLSGFLLYFAGYLAAAALACFYWRDRVVLPWVLGLLVPTALLAVNHLWHWGNHPYRFAIHMLFPLAILAALGLREAPRRWAVPIGAWLCAVCLYDAGGLVLNRTGAVLFRIADQERASFLESVRAATKPATGSGLRLLAPPELGYPRGVLQAAMLMNYSRIPGFVPDFRHVLWRERYFNRMGLFCFLFPGYPNDDYVWNRRACEEALDPEPELAVIREPRLKTEILPVYGIAFAGGPGKPFSAHLKEASRRYDWPLVASNDSAALVRTDAARLPGVARLGPATAPAGRFGIRIETDSPGPQLILLGGRRLDERASSIRLDGRTLAGGRRSPNWAALEAEIGPGPHLLELPSLDSGAEPEADYLYFAAVVSRERAGGYLGPDAHTGELTR